MFFDLWIHILSSKIALNPDNFYLLHEADFKCWCLRPTQFPVFCYCFASRFNSFVTYPEFAFMMLWKFWKFYCGNKVAWNYECCFRIELNPLCPNTIFIHYYRRMRDWKRQGFYFELEKISEECSNQFVS